MSDSFPEVRGRTSILENPQQHVAPAAAIASSIITDAGPQFWKVTLNFGKVKLPFKTTLFEGVKIIFGSQFFLRLGNTCDTTFCKKRRPKSAKYDRGM